MFARVLIQQCQPGTIELLTRRSEETFVDRLRAVPGFISYQVLKLDDQSLIATGYFETREGAETMEKLGAEWRATIGKDAIISATPYVGEVIFEAGPSPQAQRPSPEVHATH
jgi:hypothetical protein